MKFHDFIDALYQCGWRKLCDAHPINVRVLWEKLFPAHVEMENIQEQLDRTQEALIIERREKLEGISCKQIFMDECHES